MCNDKFPYVLSDDEFIIVRDYINHTPMHAKFLLGKRLIFSRHKFEWTLAGSQWTIVGCYDSNYARCNGSVAMFKEDLLTMKLSTDYTHKYPAAPAPSDETEE